MYDHAIEAIMMNVDAAKARPSSIEELDIAAGAGSIAAAALHLSHSDGRVVREASAGDGPGGKPCRAKSAGPGR